MENLKENLDQILVQEQQEPQTELPSDTTETKLNPDEIVSDVIGEAELAPTEMAKNLIFQKAILVELRKLNGTKPDLRLNDLQKNAREIANSLANFRI